MGANDWLWPSLNGSAERRRLQTTAGHEMFYFAISTAMTCCKVTTKEGGFQQNMAHLLGIKALRITAEVFWVSPIL